eukprot:637446-Amphidinium_carterae.1
MFLSSFFPSLDHLTTVLYCLDFTTHRGVDDAVACLLRKHAASSRHRTVRRRPDAYSNCVQSDHAVSGGQAAYYPRESLPQFGCWGVTPTTPSQRM